MFNNQFSSWKVFITGIISVFAISCSVSKQISKSAKETVLTNKAFVNAHVGISIFDPAANKYWYNYQGDKYFVPASNTKLPTCYAAMKYLGDSLTGMEILDEADRIIIKSTADPTFLMSEFKTHPVYNFLKNTTKNIAVVDGVTFPKPYGAGWQIGDVGETYQVPMSQFPIYGNLVTFSIDSSGNVHSIPRIFSSENNLVVFLPCNKISSVRKEDVFTNRYILSCNEKGVGVNSIQIPFRPEYGLIFLEILKDTLKKPITMLFPFKNRTFKKIHSQPTDSLLKFMMHRSDNFYAEQSLLMVSYEKLGLMDDAKIIDTILKTDFRDLPQKPRWADGSGLSRYNLFTPQDFVAILNKMKNEFGMKRLKVIMATGGEGTISSYYKADSGYIYGKTGTLSGVVAFSGFLYTKKGKLLIFSTLVNNHQATTTDIRRAIERFIQGIRNKF